MGHSFDNNINKSKVLRCGFLLSIECLNALLNIIKFKKYITKLPHHRNILDWSGKLLIDD